MNVSLAYLQKASVYKALGVKLTPDFRLRVIEMSPLKNDPLPFFECCLKSDIQIFEGQSSLRTIERNVQGGLFC